MNFFYSKMFKLPALPPRYFQEEGVFNKPF